MRNLALGFLALSPFLVLGAWKWGQHLERQISAPRVLNYRIEIGEHSPGYSSTSQSQFTLWVSGIRGFKSGSEERKWHVEQIRFRAKNAALWKKQDPKKWPYFVIGPTGWDTDGQTQTQLQIYDLDSSLSSIAPEQLQEGEYEAKVRLSEERIDTKSGSIFRGAGRFQFRMEVKSELNPKYPGTKFWRVVLRHVKKL